MNRYLETLPIDPNLNDQKVQREIMEGDVDYDQGIDETVDDKDIEVGEEDEKDN